MEKTTGANVDLSNSSHTCITCRVVFARGDLQRDHYKSDWHRYNLKRKVSELPPVTAVVFQNKVLAQRQQEEEKTKDVSLRCECCYKSFQSKETYESHCRSKKHMDNAAKRKHSSNGTVVKPEPVSEKEPAVKETEEEMEVIGEDDGEWVTDEEEEKDEEGRDEIPSTHCFFCSHSSADTGLEENLAHMWVKHGFFVPDVEYCTDVEGLLTYLGAKVGVGLVCLWCNERGRSFQSLDAVQKHMRDKGHCKMQHDGEAMLEYADFYDYSSSYPDGEKRADESEKELDEVGIDALEERGWQLVLPSGATVGHRSLMRYYRQRLKPESRVQVVTKQNKISPILNRYRALGWTGTSGEAAVRKAKDLATVNRILSKHQLKVAVWGNKLQKHFRAQTNF